MSISFGSITPYQGTRTIHTRPNQTSQPAFTGINYGKGFKSVGNAIYNINWSGLGQNVSKIVTEAPAKLQPANDAVSKGLKWFWDLIKPVSN